MLPTQNRVIRMKKLLLLLTALLIMLPMMAKEPDKVFERTDARILEPEMKVFIRPQIGDFEILEDQHRCYYGPYRFPIKSWESMTEGELTNLKTSALFRAQKEADADIIIGVLFDSYVYDADGKTLIVELSGFPAKFVNFRNLGEENTSEYQMIQVVYPANTNKLLEEALKTQVLKNK